MHRELCRIYAADWEVVHVDSQRASDDPKFSLSATARAALGTALHMKRIRKSGRYYVVVAVTETERTFADVALHVFDVILGPEIKAVN